MLCGLLAPAHASGAEGFTDVPSTHVRHTEISQAVEQGLFTGTSDTTFDPEGPMTRAMLAVVISRLAGVSVDNSSQSSFTDVPAGAWYSGAAAWAAKAGIVGDASAAAFEPDAVITGEELTTLLTKYADYACISLSADEIQGLSDPKATLTRAETASVLVRFSEIQSVPRGLDLSAYAANWTYTPANSFELVAMISSGWGAAAPGSHRSV